MDGQQELLYQQELLGHRWFLLQNQQPPPRMLFRRIRVLYHKIIRFSSEIFGDAECEIIHFVNCEISHFVRCEMK